MSTPLGSWRKVNRDQLDPLAKVDPAPVHELQDLLHLHRLVNQEAAVRRGAQHRVELLREHVGWAHGVRPRKPLMHEPDGDLSNAPRPCAH